MNIIRNLHNIPHELLFELMQYLDLGHHHVLWLARYANDSIEHSLTSVIDKAPFLLEVSKGRYYSNYFLLERSAPVIMCRL